MQTKRKFSNEGQEILMDLEGFKSQPYKDLAGHLTIGFGHKVLPGEKFDIITKPTGIMIMMKDAKPFEDFLNNNIPVELTQNQFDALIIFIFNIGKENFIKSNVYKQVKLGNFKEATIPWAKWINISKWETNPKTGIKEKKLVPVQGLINRRKREIQLFERV